MQTLTIHPGESLTYAFDFRLEPALASSTLSGTPTVSQTTVRGSGDLTISEVTIVGSRVQCRIADPQINNVHRLTCVVATAAGDTLSLSGLLAVTRGDP